MAPARPWLVCLVATFFSAACFDSPAEYSVPERTPPIIDVAGVTPSTLGINTIGPSATSQSFDVPFRAEDLGEPISSRFYLDLYPNESDPGCLHLLDNVDVLGDSRPILEQNGRSFNWLWVWGQLRPSGCHSVTLIITYVSNLKDDPDSGTKTCQEKEDNDVAQVTWFLDFQGSTTTGITTCPPPVVTQQQQQ
jgi:hypothetical protein